VQASMHRLGAIFPKPHKHNFVRWDTLEGVCSEWLLHSHTLQRKPKVACKDIEASTYQLDMAPALACHLIRFAEEER
jgi:hypothetical protein